MYVSRSKWKRSIETISAPHVLSSKTVRLKVVFVKYPVLALLKLLVKITSLPTFW